MAREPETADPGESARCDLVIRSIGSAIPRTVAAAATGLGVPAEALIAAVYRAPSRVLHDLPRATVQRLAALLGELGLAAEACPAGTSVAAPDLFDVAAEIVAPDLVDAAAAALGEFIGITAEAALDLLLAPPGMVLGGVSPATVAALEARLPAGALALTVADAARSTYALFATALGEAERRAIDQTIPGRVVPAGDGLAATGLDRPTADRLWRQLAAGERVRLVPEPFLRFDLELVTIPSGAEAALEQLAEVPSDQAAALRELLPVVIEERVPHGELASRLAAFAAHGIEVVARLATFAATTLELRRGPPAALALAGVAARTALPVRLPPLPAVRARLLRAKLEAAGAEVLQLAEAA
ncbi:MAG: hypothetical protein ABW194_01450 [Novosphingobium sp.]